MLPSMRLAIWSSNNWCRDLVVCSGAGKITLNKHIKMSILTRWTMLILEWAQVLWDRFALVNVCVGNRLHILRNRASWNLNSMISHHSAQKWLFVWAILLIKNNCEPRCALHELESVEQVSEQINTEVINFDEILVELLRIVHKELLIYSNGSSAGLFFPRNELLWIITI